jgi:hypothetical protein
MIGARLSPARLHQIQMMVNYMRLGNWMARHGYRVARRLPDRYAVFEVVAEQVRHKRVLYLEFGVFQGASMRYWASALKHPEARLHGFDSFEGLPEDMDMDGPYLRGTFDVKGQIPQIDDPRVEFFKGWFEATLPAYRPPEHEVMVIVIDADLYSSTQCVLRYLGPLIKAGDFLYFDDMSRPEHEPRAFEEFVRESGRRFRLVAVDYSLNNAFFECLG